MPALGAHLRLLPGAHGSFGDGIRTSQSPGRHDALRHSCLSAPRERLDDIRAVLGAGDIEVRTGCDVQTDEMRTLVDEFDAVYVAVGAQGGKTPFH